MKILEDYCEFVMVSVDEAVIVKLKKDGQYFEVLVDPVKVLELKKGKEMDLDTVLAYPAIYQDARKGNVASDEDLQKNFGTRDIHRIARKIIDQGNMQFTTEQRRKFVEDKTKEIANIISRRGINPQTNTPHPPQRILNAMEKVGVHVDPFVDAKMQVNEAVKSIKPLLPIRFENVVVQIIIPAKHVGIVYSMLKRSFKDFKEEWMNDGSLKVTFDIPAGMHAELLEKIGNATKGDFSSKIIKRVGL